jgi:hypothetical protein
VNPRKNFEKRPRKLSSAQFHLSSFDQKIPSLYTAPTAAKQDSQHAASYDIGHQHLASLSDQQTLSPLETLE